ncbi:MAG: hypothetical protein ACP5NX_00535 [Candidatus Bilamarchaeaceae archaeon]
MALQPKKKTFTSEFTRVFNHASDFYMRNMGMAALFSLPLLLVFLAPLFIPQQSYFALGGFYLRTASIPDMSYTDLAVLAFVFVLSAVIVADVFVRVCMLVKADRTFTEVSKKSSDSFWKYVMKVFVMFLMFELLIFALQLVTMQSATQALLFSFAMLVFSVLFFFAPPSVVIDEKDTFHAAMDSFKLFLQKPMFLVAWVLIGFVAVSFVELLFITILPGWLSPFVVVAVNALFISPFMVILQAHLYMEKYPMSL